MPTARLVFEGEREWRRKGGEGVGGGGRRGRGDFRRKLGMSCGVCSNVTCAYMYVIQERVLAQCQATLRNIR